MSAANPKPTFRDVFAQLLDHYRSGEKLEVFQAESDVRFYTDEAWLEKEKEVLFSDTPILVGHVGMLKNPGDVFTHDHLGQPIMVVKAEDGEIRAFLNVCRHRGVRLVDAPTKNADETVNKKTFVCPYHNWTYKLDGDLKYVPLEEECFHTFEKSCHNLKALPIGISEGLIFVNPTPNGTMDIKKHMGAVSEDFKNFGMAEHIFFRQTETVVKANWKLIVEAFQDGYHVTRLHRNTVGKAFLDCVSASERNGDHMISVVARNEFATALEQDPSEWDLRTQSSCAMYLFPNVEMVIHPDYISYLALFPTKVDETVVIHGCFIEEEPKDEKAQAHWERAFDIIENGVFGPEDFFVCEQAQIGLKSGANDKFLFGTHEKAVNTFHQILKDKLGEFAPSN